MLGFVKKDLLMIKSNFKFFAILLFAYGAMAFQGEMYLSFLLPFMSVMIMVSTFSYDTYNNWDAYAITLPDGRKNSVRAKYLSTILLIIMATIVVTILGIIIAYVRDGSINFENILSIMLGSVFATVILQSFMYPSIYKFGVEKSRIGTFIIAFVIGIIGGLISKFIDFTSLTKVFNFISDYWMIVISIITILMLCVSYKISEKIYMNKEF